MRALLVCVTAFLAAPTPGGAAQEGGVADPAGFTGSWIGTLDAGDGVQLRLRLVVSEGDGVLSIPEFSVERWNWETRRSQMERFHLGAPIATLNGHTISVALSTIEASYTGTFSPEDGEIGGTFTQWGETFPLVLKQSSEDEGQPRRPQTPEVFHAQAALKVRAGGVSEEAIAEILKRPRAIFEILKSESDPEGGGEAIAAIIRPWLENASVQERALYGIAHDTTLETAVEALVQRVNNPWQRYFLTHEPAEVLERVTVPVLALSGTRDLYVPHEENLREIEAALKRGGNTRYEIHALPHLNHFFQHAVTGTASESETIEETVAVEVIELIAEWILRVTM